MNGRPSRDNILMETAELWSQRATCSRLQVGCVIARDSRILATGYNGAPAGMEHCNHECDCNTSFIMSLSEPHHNKHCNSLQPCKFAVHAEANAIVFAARYGLSLEGASLYTTYMPCPGCCLLIVNSGLSVVVWKNDFRDMSGLDTLRAGNVAAGKFNKPLSVHDKVDS